MSRQHKDCCKPWKSGDGPHDKEKTDIIIGVDFGTTHSGVAYALQPQNAVESPLMTEWLGLGEKSEEKSAKISIDAVRTRRLCRKGKSALAQRLKQIKQSCEQAKLAMAFYDSDQLSPSFAIMRTFAAILIGGASAGISTYLTLSPAHPPDLVSALRLQTPMLGLFDPANDAIMSFLESEWALPVACVGVSLASTTLYSSHDLDVHQDRFILGALVGGLGLGAGSGLSIKSTMLAVLPWTVLAALLVSAVWHHSMRSKCCGNCGHQGCCKCGGG